MEIEGEGREGSVPSLLFYFFNNFYMRGEKSAVLATATCLAGWLGVRHTPVLYQNG